MDLQYLVTGTGRCGTVFMARLLTSVGVPCGHETIFDWQGQYGAKQRLTGKRKLELSIASRRQFNPVTEQSQTVSEWVNPSEIVAESSYMAAPFLEEITCPVIHVVRHPVKVVRSFCDYIGYFQTQNSGNTYERFMYRYVPDLKLDMPQYDRGCLYYVLWNEMIERHESALFHRVEDGSEPVLEYLAKQGPCFNERGTNTYQKKTAQRFDVDKIASQEIKSRFVAIGERYGYNMSPECLLL